MPPRRNLRGSGRLKGLFADGIWQCDCDPRLPAEHFKVKKDGKNHGRWFYTCQKAEGDRCGFFLWEEEAKPREASAVLNSSRNEPRSTPNIGDNRHGAQGERIMQGGRGAMISPPPPYSDSGSNKHQTTHQITRGSGKFQAGVDDVDIDQDLLAAESALMHDRSRDEPQTPAKRKYTDFNVNDNQYGLPTPDSHGAKSIESVRKRHAGGSDLWGRGTNGSVLSGPATAEPEPEPQTDPRSVGSRRGGELRWSAAGGDTTPTPSRFRDACAPGEEEDLFASINETLRVHHIHLAAEARRSLEALCVRNKLRGQGVAKGREIARLALKAKEARIAELEHRTRTLEAELDMQKALVKHLKWEKDNDLKPLR